MRRITAVITVIVFVVFSAIAFAQSEVKPMQKMKGSHGMECQHHMFSMLDLTDEQQTKITDLKLQHQKEILPLKSQMVEKRNELKVLMTSDNPDRSQINEIINQTGDIQKELKMKKVDHMIKVRSLLDADQKKKFDMKILSGKHGMHHGGKKMKTHHKKMMQKHRN